MVRQELSPAALEGLSKVVMDTLEGEGAKNWLLGEKSSSKWFHCNGHGNVRELLLCGHVSWGRPHPGIKTYCRYNCESPWLPALVASDAELPQLPISHNQSNKQ